MACLLEFFRGMFVGGQTATRRIVSAPRCVGVALVVAISCGTALALGYRRGDADCNLEVSVADIVAVVQGLTAHSICDNDDCDRDGQVTAADVECTAFCVFG